MHCYFWIIFCTVAVFSIWALPVDEHVEEGSLAVIGNENEDAVVSSGALVEKDDDDEEEAIVADGTSDITDRHFKGKPQKYNKKDQKPNKNKYDDDSDDDSDDDDETSSEEGKEKKKYKKPKCVCFGKKPGQKKPPRNQSNSILFSE